MCECLYFLCDVQVAGVDAICEQILCAAALAGPKHTVVGLEQLTAEEEDKLETSNTDKGYHYPDVKLKIVCCISTVLYHMYMVVGRLSWAKLVKLPQSLQV